MVVHNETECCLYLQFCYYRTTGEIYIGKIKSHKYNDNRCLVDTGIGDVPGLFDCKLAKQKGFNMLWDFKQVMSLLKPLTIFKVTENEPL